MAAVAGLMVTVFVPDDVQPKPLVTVTVYVIGVTAVTVVGYIYTVDVVPPV